MMHGLSHLTQWRPGRLAWNAFGGMVGYGTRLAMQAAYFLLLARLLGAEGFGLFAGIWVVAGIMSALSGQGFQVLTMRTAALAPEDATACMARGLRVVATLAPGAILVFVIAGLAFFPGPPPILALVSLAISEIALVAALGVIAGWHQGSERLARSHAVMAVLWVARLAGLLALVALDMITVAHVAVLHALMTTVVTAFWLGHNRSHIALRDLRWPSRRELLLGSSFCASTVALIVYTEFNQSLTLAMVGASATALLAVPYKLSTLFSAPMSAMCQAIAPRLLRAADAGPPQLHALGGRLALPFAGLAAACTAGVLLLAGMITPIFGKEYEPAIRIAQIFSVLPLLTSVRLLSVYLIAASSRQGARVAAELACMTFGLAANFMLIRAMGLTGAVLGTLLVEGVTAATLAIVAWRVLSRMSKADEIEGAGNQ